MLPPDPGPQPGDLTPWTARSTRVQRVRRGVVGRCPRCGGGGIGASFLDLRDACPHCAWTFEREEGFWLGALMVLLGAVEGLFVALLLAVILPSWPEVPWNQLLWAGLLLNGLVPVVLYRWSKTTWLGLHAAFVPQELETDAANRTGRA